MACTTTERFNDLRRIICRRLKFNYLIIWLSMLPAVQSRLASRIPVILSCRWYLHFAIANLILSDVPAPDWDVNELQAIKDRLKNSG